ncbi:hypothetical protein V6N13_087052 [Hibiscus sabdariffa]
MLLSLMKRCHCLKKKGMHNTPRRKAEYIRAKWTKMEMVILGEPIFSLSETSDERKPPEMHNPTISKIGVKMVTGED